MTDLAEHIRRTVEAAPPLTPEQRDRLALLLRGDHPAPERTLAREDAEDRRRRETEARQTRDALKIARAVLACDVCDCPRYVHDGQDHPWVPGRVDRVVARITKGKTP